MGIVERIMWTTVSMIITQRIGRVAWASYWIEAIDYTFNDDELNL